jgi:hypothetical protein
MLRATNITLETTHSFLWAYRDHSTASFVIAMKRYSTDDKHLPNFDVLVVIGAPKSGNFAPAHKISRVKKEKFNFD